MPLRRAGLLAVLLSIVGFVPAAGASTYPGGYPGDYPSAELVPLSGMVYDATLAARLQAAGLPSSTAIESAGISGATLTLQRQTALGFVAVPSGDPAIGGQANPRTTTASLRGFYLWSVTPGTYRMQVSAARYRSTTSAAVVVTGPWVASLNLGLTPDCPTGQEPSYGTYPGGYPTGTYPGGYPPGMYPGLYPGGAPTCTGSAGPPNSGDGGAPDGGSSGNGGASKETGADPGTGGTGGKTPPPPRATLSRLSRSLLRVDRRGHVVVPCRLTVVGAAMRCRVTIRAAKGRPTVLGTATRSLVGGKASPRLRLSKSARRDIRRASRRGLAVAVTIEALSGGGKRLAAATTKARLRFAT